MMALCKTAREKCASFYLLCMRAVVNETSTASFIQLQLVKNSVRKSRRQLKCAWVVSDGSRVFVLLESYTGKCTGEITVLCGDDIYKTQHDTDR